MFDGNKTHRTSLKNRKNIDLGLYYDDGSSRDAAYCITV